MSEEIIDTSTETALDESSSTETILGTDNDPVVSGFLDGVDSQFRDDPSISKFKNLNDLAREHVNLQSLLGRKGVVIPKEGDSEEIWNRYRSEMNVPSDSSQYLNEDNSEENGLSSKLAEIAHQNNLSKDQYENIIKGYEDWQEEGISLDEKEIEIRTSENIDSLKKEWGRAFTAKTDIGASALNNITNGNSETVASIQLSDGTFLGNNPEFIKVMASIGETLQEKGLMNGQPLNMSSESPESAKQKLSSMMADGEKAEILFSQDFHPAKEELVKERERLLSFAYPEE